MDVILEAIGQFLYEWTVDRLKDYFYANRFRRTLLRSIIAALLTYVLLGALAELNDWAALSNSGFYSGGMLFLAFIIALIPGLAFVFGEHEQGNTPLGFGVLGLVVLCFAVLVS